MIDLIADIYYITWVHQNIPMDKSFYKKENAKKYINQLQLNDEVSFIALYRFCNHTCGHSDNTYQVILNYKKVDISEFLKN